MKKCSIPNCDNPGRTRTWCHKHYARWRTYADPVYPVRVQPIQPVDPVSAFWEQVEKTEGCWLWTGVLTTQGYGSARLDGKMVLAHRYSFFLANGYWAQPCCLHSCDIPRCVNPEHLREGTNADNIRDKVERNRTTKQAVTFHLFILALLLRSD